MAPVVTMLGFPAVTLAGTMTAQGLDLGDAGGNAPRTIIKRGITVLALLSALVSVGHFTASKWAIRHETLTFHDQARDN